VPATPPEPAGNPYTPPDAAANPYAASYAPPRSQVADAEEDLIERPPKVTRAVRCLWIGWVLSALIVLYTLGKPEEVRNVGPAFDARATILAFTISICALMYAVAAWINVKISRGRNWARILYLVINLLWLPALPALAIGAFAGAIPVFELLANLASFALSMVTCYLLLTRESNEWFAAVGNA
jgi:hypothetical protein